MLHHIFLSYSRRDFLTMQRVRDDLVANGLSVWTDEGIHPGTISWKESIEEAICGAGMVLVLLSPDANDSTWVQREIDYAEVQGIPVLPVLIRGETREAIPFALAGAQFIDLRSHYEIGMKLLLQRCMRRLPAKSIKTVLARPASPTIPSFKTQQRRREKWYAFFSVLLLPLLLGFGFFAGKQSSAEASVPPSASLAPATETNPISVGNVVLRYNRETLVLINQANQSVSLYGLRFELAIDNRQFVFSADEWLSQTLSTGRCVQVWGLSNRYLAEDAPPADDCQSRVAYRSTSDIFWLGTNTDFVIFRYGEEIQRCPVLAPDSEDTLDCLLEL